MKTVVGIIGSLRKASINRVLFEEYKSLSADYFKLVEGEIGDIPPYNQDIKEQPESVSKLCEKIATADGLLIFSPEYNYSIPGVLKNVLDWVSLDDQKPLNNKPGAILGASPGGIGTARMQYHLRQVSVSLNIQMLNKPEVMVSKAGDKIKDGKLVDGDTKEFLKKHVKAFADHMTSK